MSRSGSRSGGCPNSSQQRAEIAHHHPFGWLGPSHCRSSGSQRGAVKRVKALAKRVDSSSVLHAYSALQRESSTSWHDHRRCGSAAVPASLRADSTRTVAPCKAVGYEREFFPRPSGLGEEVRARGPEPSVPTSRLRPDPRRLGRRFVAGSLDWGRASVSSGPTATTSSVR
jgi:hypothetical protein